ncbi:hypothetical protein [Actinoplanes sp. M2I2]|uniref:MmyB family transcriptional regulator n=1 Tax=Actinoplanes sp. M2I2 TaxID=1734444 RepID=UPI0020222A17|nr:hypothetical protein [Actinoplanes sp. M2I2]
MPLEGVLTAHHARFAFLDPRARDFWRDWERIATMTVAMLRAEAGRNPYDKALTDLVGELGTRSDEFRARWAAHDVRLHDTGIKQFRHPVIGDLDLNFETMDLTADPGMSLTVLTAPAGSADDDALRLRATWAATHAQATTSPNPPIAESPPGTASLAAHTQRPQRPAPTTPSARNAQRPQRPEPATPSAHNAQGPMSTSAAVTHHPAATC